MNFLAACDIQIGKESNWLKITSDHNRSVLLKADGTLWQCVFQSEHPDASHIKRFSNYSDWVDIRSTDLNSFIALAADGSLWFWWFEPEQYSRHEPHLLLAQSRRPQYLGNIFSKEP